MVFEFIRRLWAPKQKIELTDITRRFELISRVGQGSMSRVWRARDTKTGQLVALKVLDKLKTEQLEARFAGLARPTEGEIAVQLKHPNIVETYEYGWTKELEQFLVMEFIEGVGLSYLVDVQSERMKKHRISYMIQLGEAIDWLHRHDWIHRDICPRNVMVRNDNVVKLIDFGLVVPNTPEFQRPGNRTGTATHMAPELIKRQRTDHRIDLYSYAVTCYEMWTGELPFEADRSLDAVVKHINQPPRDIRSLNPEVPELVAETIMKGLEKHPDDRWSSASEMVERFREAQRQLAEQ
ncbi:MAG: serine/threonine protein kinase [Planctomycetota bacterium]|nr:MAG: serine/threonine protein kinase [Planctomycetota bacterium]